MREWCILALLGINTWTDVKKREVSLVSVAGFGIIGLAWGLWKDAFTWQYLLSGGLCTCFLGLSVLTKGAVGMGDCLLLLALGVLLEPEEFLAVVFLGMLCCAVWAAVILAVFRKGRNTEIPFVPFLLLGYMGNLLAERIIK